ncbi:AAA family ATPase [Roseateles sp. SL47]|uniref:AAA family ATPase n=1 Tax=Roseateles sp. SL47 TaxID=2995138 RepID=UPI00226DE051|nr:AAA family ATPase [Roseateles sp. SL47]WAC73538.1 AAA family ATPase [Roseateles sp. SL47]
MDNFSVVYAVCRAALAGDRKDGRHQVDRLKAALKRKGATDDVAMLDRLVKELDSPGLRGRSGFEPSRASSAHIAFPGEPLVSDKHVPVDKDSGAPLAEVIGLDRLPAKPPTLPLHVLGAVQSVLNEWTHAEMLDRMGLSPAKTCLIFGPPGTGKTQLALWLSSQLGLPVILAKLDGLMSSYLGTTSRNIANLFAFANRHRALLLLDEFDSIAKLRDDPNEMGELKRVVNTLLQELDRRRTLGLTVSITNHASLLDPAVWRRFELQLELPVPDVIQRGLILERYLPPLEMSAGQMQLLTWMLVGCSGSEIEDIALALKKSSVLEPDTLFLERLQRIAASHSDRLHPDIRSALSSDKEALADLLLKEFGGSQSRVADALGVNRSTVSRWIKDESQPKEEIDGRPQGSSARHKPSASKAATRR